MRFARVSAFCKKHGFSSWSFSADLSTFKVRSRHQYQRDVIELKLKDKYSVQYLADSLDLIELFNLDIFHRTLEIGDRFDESSKPTWSRERAITIAKDFALEVLGKFPELMRNPQASYEENRNGSKYQAGNWTVTWSRVDSKGRPFELEYLTVSLFEKDGPFLLSLNTPSKYEEIATEPLKKEEVLEIAIAGAHEIIKWPVVSDRFVDGMLDTKAVRASLEIVKPNRLVEHGKVPTEPDLNARLAWVFWFTWRPKDGTKREEPIAVWIDAHTKEFLGGDLSL